MEKFNKIVGGRISTKDDLRLSEFVKEVETTKSEIIRDLISEFLKIKKPIEPYCAQHLSGN